MTEPRVCLGCGIELQSKDQSLPGYVPTSALERETVLCQRCFRLKHYNETEDVSITDDEFFKMVSSIHKTDGLILYMIDLFDVAGSLIYSLPRIIGSNPIILVGNKVDLLPKSTNKRKLDHWLRRQMKEAGIKVKDVFLISSTKGHGLAALKHAIENYREDKDVYIVGMTNVGKSTFVNRLIEETSGLKQAITTSYFPGTTLGFIKIPLDQKSYMIDTPGIVNKKQIVHYISDQDMKTITPNKEIKARVYQLSSEQTLFIGGLARIDFIKGGKQSFVCYFANNIKIHRTKLKEADDLFKKQFGKLLTPPKERSKELLPPFVKSSYRIKQGKTDIVIPGLGWITLVDGEATVIVYTPKNVIPSIRESFV